jgi:hypothetical protein
MFASISSLLSHRFPTFVAAAVCSALLVSPELAQAQFAQQGPKLVGTGAVGNANQGNSVSLSADGNTAIVAGAGDNYDSNTGRGLGATWVFTRNNGVWTQQGSKLVGTGAVGSASQGSAVALSADGNTAIAGGSGDDDTGASWVFTRSGDVWSQQGNKLVGSDIYTDTSQGSAVALSADGNTAIIGGPSPPESTGPCPYRDGAAWLFTRSNGVWSQQGDKLVGTGSDGGASQGSSVALSPDGNTAIVGGPTDGCAGPGAAWVYIRNNGVWTQQGGKLVATDAVGPSAGQGSSVALSADGNTAIVGGSGDNSSTGAAWVYTRSNGVWTQQGSKLVGTDAVGKAQQGLSVALSADGNTAIVGGPKDNVDLNSGFGLGAAWVFTRSNGVWTQQGSKLVGTDAVGQAEQGWSVSLSGEGKTAIVGGPTDNGGTGAAWVFIQSTATTLQVTPATNMVTVGNPGGPFTPPSFQYQLSATAGINYSISGVPDWLTATATPPSTVPATVTFTVNDKANSLAVGTYGPITITRRGDRNKRYRRSAAGEGSDHDHTHRLCHRR